MRVVAHVEQRQQGGHQVDLRDDAVDHSGFDKPGGEDQRRDVVFLQRNLGAAGARSAVVGRDEEDRVFEPRLPGRFGEELPQRIVAVKHASCAALRVVGDADSSGGVGEGTVVADGHHVGEERLAAAGLLVERADDLPVGVFVADAPDVGEGDLFGLVAFLVDDVVSVAREEGLHVVEIAVAAVEIGHVVTLVAQQGSCGVHSGVVRTLDDALARAGRQRKRHGLQTAHRAVARGVDAVERQSQFVERVEYGRDPFRVAEPLHVRGAHALHGDQHDVAADLLPFGAHGVQVVARALVDPVHEGFGLGFGTREVELFVVECVLDEGVVELVESVGLQFVDVDVVAVLEAGVEVQQPDRGEQRRDVGRSDYGFPPPAFQAFGLHEFAAEEVPCHEQRHDDDAQRHRNDGVGLHDVAHHLVGVDQVIDGDEVVADAEFAPEEIFADAVEDDGAHVDDDEEGEPHRGPVAAESGQEKPQCEAAGPVAQHIEGDSRRDASVFVEDRVEERHVAERRHEQGEEDVAPRLFVLGARNAQHEEPEENESRRRGAEIVHGAQQEDFAPFAE